MNNTLQFERMTIKSYGEIYDMWNSIQGIGVSDADSKEAIERYLERNPSSSFVCYEENKLIGTILCGHDGRRGYIHHTCVLPEYRGRNIGKTLVEKALEELKKEGINKCHLFVFYDNELGNGFWNNVGWEKRSDLLIYSKRI
ncbi:GNAT family N-acetyltransferase [Oceanirhabdus sp. W0125-5]|uniref:GNAT family N-acetyltransferase n=1 Tax=Oceanirhabdus sp. W0125-5 TaxID=2999116 RepID=UPI0022F2CFF1|nr:GNAT family N-acetyltransferase [Oceanirhabdus sp. W0125-5]WBW97306.1 GNAT family N-acetyltransferase [Oceanirhabdus sp. W0125-5]